MEVVSRAIESVVKERERQTEKWGIQDHPDGTGHNYFKATAERSKAITDHATKLDALFWWHILDEEVQEAFAESDPKLLREELVHVAAVAIAWIENLDRNAK